MKLTLNMSLDNAAFQDAEYDESDHVYAPEVARIFRALADKIEGCSLIVDEEEWPLMDRNGNKVGKCNIA